MFRNIPHLFVVKLGCLFMKNHQLLNSTMRKAVASLCVDVVRRENPCSTATKDGECTTGATSKTRARVSPFSKKTSRKPHSGEVTVRHISKIALKIALFSQPNYVIRRV